MKIAIVGLGYVGLPLAALCAKKGFETIGLDTKHDVVEMLNNGNIHIKDDIVKASFAEAFATGNFIATTDIRKIEDCKIKIICVPTPVDNEKNPDLSPLEGASRSIMKHLKPRDLVVVESTVFPGTCEEYVVPVLEESGLVAGKDFFLAHCPERVNPGDVFWSVENIPRVVGALSQKGADIAARFYQKLLDGPISHVNNVRDVLRPKIIPHETEGYRINKMPLGSVTKMNSIRDAEAVKAMENTVRDVNIAFVNELAKISDVLGLNVLDIIEGMATKPFGKGPFYPGCGVGGHCIAVDPEWLKKASARAGYMPRLIELARTTNNSMPEYTVSLLQNQLNEVALPLKGTKVALLGVSYKGNVDDPRESPFYDIKNILEKKGVQTEVFDPWYTKENTVKTLHHVLRNSDALIVTTDHYQFKEYMTADILKKHKIKVVIDGRNCLDSQAITSAGILYRGIGKC